MGQENDLPLEEYHRAGLEITNGNPDVYAVRVTTVFRREDGAWKVTHRHADPITGPRPAKSVIAR